MSVEASVKEKFLVHVVPDLSAPENQERGITEVKTVFYYEVRLTDELETYDRQKHDHSNDNPISDPEVNPHIHRQKTP